MQVRSTLTNIANLKTKNFSHTLFAFQKANIDSKRNPSTDLCTIKCYFDAIPYLQLCRERQVCICNEDGPITLLFDFFAEVVDPNKQMNNNKLTFDEIDEANNTICLLEMLMFCDYWGIFEKSYVSRLEICSLLRYTLRFFPELNAGDMNIESFCDFLCYLAIVVYSRPPLQNSILFNTKSKKIQAFINQFKLNDLNYVIQKLAIPKKVGLQFDTV